MLLLFWVLYLIALQAGQYKTVGTMLAYTIVHNGPLPQFFSPLMYRVLSEGIDGLCPLVSDIPDIEYRQKLEKVSSFYILLKY